MLPNSGREVFENPVGVAISWEIIRPWLLARFTFRIGTALVCQLLFTYFHEVNSH